MFSAAQAFADTGPVRLGRVELYPTWSAVGIEVSYAGDATRQSQAEFVWRRAGEKAWRNGVDMTFDRDRKLIWASIWPLAQGEVIEVRLTLTDPRLSVPILYDGTTATRTMTLDPPAGARRHYVSPDGDDFKPGTRQRPFRTLRHASAVARAGDVIVVHGGVYREGDLFSRMAGTPGAPIFIQAAAGERPVLDGAMEISPGAGWQSLSNGIHALALPTPPAALQYLALDGERIFHFESRAAMEQDVHDTNWGDRYTVQRGWFYDAAGATLYVRLRDGTSPAAHAFQLPLYAYGALLAGSQHVVLRGFEIRNYGHACVRISEGATGCIVYSNDLHNAQAGVFVLGEDTQANAVWHNRIHEPGLAKYSWGQNKRSGDQRQGITGWAGGVERGRMGRGMSFCHNEIEGWFDGIMPGGWNRTDRLDLSRDMDIMFNTIRDIGDDAIEVDSGAVNQRVHGNTVRNAFAAFAAAAVEKGPVYFTRNTATFYVLGFKLNVGGPESLGWMYAYHNALYCLSHGNSYGGTGISFPDGKTMPIANKVFLNNALVVDGRGIRFGRDGHTLDHNCYGAVPGQEPVQFLWEFPGASNTWDAVVYHDLDTLRAATGQEVHGMTADPRFVATPGLGGFERGDYGPLPFTDFLAGADGRGADLRLAPDSPCLDAGAVIRGINEDFSGAAPDIGAFEQTGSP